MSYFSTVQALHDIGRFLGKWRSTLTNLDLNMKPSAMFEAYTFTQVAEAFAMNDYRVDAVGSIHPFVFKKSVKGNPNNYSHFRIGEERLELRQNQPVNNRYEVEFNLDITLSRRMTNGLVDYKDLHTFLECKHYRSASPMVFAQFMGVTREIIPSNFAWTSHDYPKPTLLVSGTRSSSLVKMFRSVRLRGFHIDLFTNVTPVFGNPLTNWARL